MKQHQRGEGTCCVWASVLLGRGQWGCVTGGVGGGLVFRCAYLESFFQYYFLFSSYEREGVKGLVNSLLPCAQKHLNLLY